MEHEELIELAGALRRELAKVIVGQERVLDQVVVALLAGGHVLLEGPPGTAKTLLVRALALAVQGKFGRVQFTADLMPADITGVNVYRQQTAQFTFQPGPIFCDLLLADEINRAPAKTQAALLEAMQEGQVSVDGTHHPLSRVFTAFATQNPIEYEGTYPLPEAQLDRFLLKILLDYPELEAEQAMLQRHQDGFDPNDGAGFRITPAADADALARARSAVRRIHAAPDVIAYIAHLVRNTRSSQALMLGASPRGGVMLLAAARAAAVLHGRSFVTPDDVQEMAAPVLRHRIVLNPETEIEGTTADRCVEQVIKRTDVPRLEAG